jgi:hypothetical protein
VPDGEEVIGSLVETPFPELMARLRESTKAFRQQKSARFEQGEVADEDFFPCDYCLKQFHKVAGFAERPIWLTETTMPSREGNRPAR